MGLGQQSKGLIQANKMAGWDPCVIPARGGKPEVNIANFDKAPDPYDHKTTGQFEGGTPMAWPTHDPIKPGTPWETRLQSEPLVRRATKNANPIPGMPGA